MQTHVAKLTKQRLSDFFVKEDGHVAHKNALVAGTVATGAILASVRNNLKSKFCEEEVGQSIVFLFFLTPLTFERRHQCC